MRIGIIGAMEEETAWLEEVIDLQSKEIYAGLEFNLGRIENRECIVVKSGIGKVNAALCAQILITRFGVDAIVNTGLAGALDDSLEIGDVVVSEELVEHDFDARSFGYGLGEIPRMDTSVFKADETLVELVERTAGKRLRVKRGRILSGDVFVADEELRKHLRTFFKGACAEMEGAAIAHVCHVNNIPFVIIRTISDKADQSADFNFNAFVKSHARESGMAVVDLISALERI